MKTDAPKLISTPRTNVRRLPRRSFRLLPIVDSYLLRTHIEATLSGFALFAGLLFVVTIITAVKKAVDNSLALGSVLNLTIYEAPRIVLFALPMSILFGTVKTFSDLSTRGEITAMFAAGTPFPRLLRGPILWGVMACAVSLLLQEVAVPYGQRRRDSDLAELIQSSLAAQTDLRYEEPPPGSGPLRRVLQAQKFDPRSGLLTEPRLQIYGPDQTLSIEISARRGIWKPSSGKWKLLDGQTLYRSKNENAGQPITSQWSELACDLPNPKSMNKVALSLRTHILHGDYEVASIGQMWRFRRQVQGEIARPRAGADLKTARRVVARATYALHDKIATPLLCLVLILVGAPLGLRPPRSGGGFAMGASLVVLMTYYALYSWCVTMGASGYADPVLMAYLPIGALTFFGSVLMWKKSR